MVAGFTLGERARIDWSRVVYDLSRAGFGPAALARTAGRTTGWVDYIRNSPGAEPRYGDGVLLLTLWAKYTERPVAEAPVER